MNAKKINHVKFNVPQHNSETHSGDKKEESETHVTHPSKIHKQFRNWVKNCRNWKWELGFFEKVRCEREKGVGVIDFSWGLRRLSEHDFFLEIGSVVFCWLLKHGGLVPFDPSPTFICGCRCWGRFKALYMWVTKIVQSRRGKWVGLRVKGQSDSLTWIKWRHDNHTDLTFFPLHHNCCIIRLITLIFINLIFHVCLFSKFNRITLSITFDYLTCDFLFWECVV